MGVWALDFNPGVAGPIYKMFYFNGDVFGVNYAGAGGRGVWRRTPPNWTRHFAAVGSGRACVWDGQMWAGDGAGQSVYRSLDGVTWVQDWNPGFGVLDHWSAFNGYEDYLRVGCRACQDGLANHFWRRDKAGNWTETPIGQADINHFNDMINYGGRDGNDDLYLSAGVVDVYRWNSAAGMWDIEPTLNNQANFYFTEHQGVLYASGSGCVYRRSRYGEWMLDMANLGIAWGSSAISVGGDGVLYLAANDSVNSRVYARVGGYWVLHSTAAGICFESAVADADGNLYAGTDNCQFWAYTADFAVAPGGLPPQQMDVDGDGDALYVGVYDAAGQPILVKVGLPLFEHAVGAAVFNPGAGTAINVTCGDVGGELAISGAFAAAPGNEQVEVSEDGGATWADIDRDAWGVETAEPLLVDPDDAANRVMVTLANAQDITETFDGGATAWVVNNPGVGYSPGAAAKLPDGDELVIGDDGGNQIDYSPNRGVSLVNITGVFAGNVAALEVA